MEDKSCQCESDSQLRKRFEITSDVRICLEKIQPQMLTTTSAEAISSVASTSRCPLEGIRKLIQESNAIIRTKKSAPATVWTLFILILIHAFGFCLEKSIMQPNSSVIWREVMLNMKDTIQRLLCYANIYGSYNPKCEVSSWQSHSKNDLPLENDAVGVIETIGYFAQCNFTYTPISL